MKNITVLFALLGTFFIGNAMSADMTIYYSPSCPHCHHARDFTKNNFIYEYPNIKVTEIDVTNPDNTPLFVDVLNKCKYTNGGVPVITIGDKCFQGFGESMADEMRDAIAVGLSDADKSNAEAVKKEMSTDAEKYRSTHADKTAKIIEYTAPAKADAKKK